MNRWELMKTWKMVLPPNRPSEANLECLQRAIQLASRRESACILGSTPEYRPILRDAFKRVTIIDRSLEFKEVSDQIAGVGDNEVMIHEDWLVALPKLVNKFDFVASHSTHGNIAFGNRTGFYSYISNALHADGLFVDTIFQPTRHLNSLSDIEKRFLGRPNNLRTANDFNCIAIFQAAKILEDGLINSTNIYNWLETGIERPEILRIVETTKDVCPPGMIWHYAVGREPATFGYNDVFLVELEIPEPQDSPFHSAMTQVICRPRQRDV